MNSTPTAPAGDVIALGKLEQLVNMLLNRFPDDVITVQRNEDGELRVGMLNWFEINNEDWLVEPVELHNVEGC